MHSLACNYSQSSNEESFDLIEELPVVKDCFLAHLSECHLISHPALRLLRGCLQETLLAAPVVYQSLTP